MLRRWVGRAGVYLEEHWGILPYTPILYLFLWGATFRIIAENKRPIRFDNLGNGVYEVWCAIGLVCPVLMILVWSMIKRGGHSKVVGMWLRLGVDYAIFSSLLTFHIADARYQGRELTESHLFSRYLLGSIIIFMLTIVFRDVLAIAFNFYKVRKLRGVRSS